MPATLESEKTVSKRKVLLVEDHPMFRERLAHLINKDLDMMVCGEADNIRDAMLLVRSETPDIAIVDISLKGSSGLELIKDLKAFGINLPVLVLSMHDENLYAGRVLRAGARGYVTKQEASTAVVSAVRAILAGEIYVSQSVMTNIIDRISEKKGRVELCGIETLADRELEVFQLIGSGHSIKEIAGQLHLGETTVDTYRARIKEKLGLRSAAEVYLKAGQWVKEQGLG
jgi:DNA-binding NarL/FixJ family response regulator